MSYHISLEDYYCPNCNALYIPYEENMSCPKCKKVDNNIPKEYLEFIDKMIASLRVNKIDGGMFIPLGWYMGSFTDSVQDIIFHIFYAWDKKRPRDGELFITNYVNTLECDKEELYIKGYINSIALEIYARRKELRVSLWTRLLSKLSF